MLRRWTLSAALGAALQKRSLLPHQAFDHGDPEQNGRLAPAAVLRIMRFVGLRPDPADAAAFVRLLDEDKDGLISYRDFERGVVRMSDDDIEIDLAVR